LGLSDLGLSIRPVPVVIPSNPTTTLATLQQCRKEVRDGAPVPENAPAPADRSAVRHGVRRPDRRTGIAVLGEEEKALTSRLMEGTGCFLVLL